MKNDLSIKNDIIIPGHEIHIKASRSSGPGGQHVQKTSTRVTVRWNIHTTQALNIIQKERVLQKLQSQITHEGDIIIHNSSSRSQQQNKNNALDILAQTIRKALHVPKKRMKTRIPQKKIESRLKEKKKRSTVKKLRRKKILNNE